jgi:hypothetical protein
MKRLLVAVLILALATIGIYWYFFHRGRNFPDTILPENTAVFLYFSGSDHFRKEASGTLLWQKIESSPRKDVYQKQWDRLIRLTESVTGADPTPLLKQFTRDVSLAIVPITGAAQSVTLISYVRDEEETTEFIELRLDPALKRRFPDLRKTPVTYRDRSYYKYSSSDFRYDLSPCVAFLDHHLMITSSEPGMKILLDVKEQKLKALRTNKIYEDAKDQVHSGKGILFFLNAKSALEMVKNRLPSRAQPFWPVFVKISGVEAVQGFAYKLGFEKEGFLEEGFLAVDDARQGILKAYMAQEPQKLSGLIFLPAGSEGAGATTLPEGTAVWKEVQTQIEGVLTSGQFSQWRSMLEFLAGFFEFDFQRDLVEPIGRQFSFAYHSKTSSGPEDTRYFIAVELSQPEHFQGVIKKMITIGQQQGLQHRTLQYAGKTLNSLDVRTAIVQAVPVFWIEGSWFYIATDQEFAQQSIEAMKNKNTILNDPDFQRVTSQFPQEVSSISYTDTRATLKRYAALLQDLSTEEDRKWIESYGLVEEMKYLSEGLFGSGSYSIIEEDGIRWHSYSSVPSTLFLLQPILTTAQR